MSPRHAGAPFFGWCGRAADKRHSAAVLLALLVLLAGVDLLLINQDAWTVAVALSAAALLGLLAHTAGLDAADLGLRRDQLAAGLRWGGVLSCLVVMCYGVMVWTPVLSPAFDDERTPDNLAGVLAKVLVMIPLRTVLLEELAFRGVIWGALARDRGERIATWGSAMAFGLWHIPPALVVLRSNEALDTGSPATATTVLVVVAIVAATTAAGVLFAELRRRTKSLAAPALVHWTINSAGVLASYWVG